MSLKNSARNQKKNATLSPFERAVKDAAKKSLAKEKKLKDEIFSAILESKEKLDHL